MIIGARAERLRRERWHRQHRRQAERRHRAEPRLPDRDDLLLRRHQADHRSFFIVCLLDPI